MISSHTKKLIAKLNGKYANSFTEKSPAQFDMPNRQWVIDISITKTVVQSCSISSRILQKQFTNSQSTFTLNL
jgi:hypothetical protein